MSSELLATYAGLGTYDGTQYYIGEECLACVKDLIRALREDDSNCQIRRHLGQAGIVKKDLLHILIGSCDQPALRNDVIRLLVNLTQPAYLSFGNIYPKGKEAELMKCFMEVNYYLRLYKEAFASERVMVVLGTVLADLCQKDWGEREDDDVIVIERILLLIRNLLHVPPDPLEEKRTEDDVSVHDQVIWNIHVNGIDELLLFLGSNPEESQWCMHVLEIFFHLLKEQSPSVLAKTGKERTREERKKDEDLIDEVLVREKTEKKRSLQLRGTRHSSFGGTFIIKNQRNIAGGERVYHKAISGVNHDSYDREKRPRRVNQRKRAVHDLTKERVSTYSVRLILKNLCVQFLECCYNTLMKVVKDNIMRRRAMDNDETFYLWCLRFFMEFSRNHNFRVDIVGETLHLPTLHYIITLTANYYESMVVEKRSIMDARQWGQRLHYVVQAYKEILLYIHRMSESQDPKLKESAKVIMSNVFYHSEYREVFVTLFRNYYEVFQTRACLRDMVEGAHVYMKIMEAYCRENKHVIVQQTRKGGGGGKKGKRKKKGGSGSGKVLTEDQLIDLWETIDARVEELLEGVEPLPGSHAPFDAASQLPMEEQKIGAMGMIRMFLIDARHPEAVSLFRAAREVWPGEEFGAPGIAVDEEMDVMRELLMNPVAALPVSHLLREEEEEDSDDGGVTGGGASTSTELEFDLKTYLQKFCNNKIVCVYGLVLKDYSTNSDSINHAVVKLLYRIAVQLKMAPLLYQITIFKTILSILNEPNTPRFKELKKLGVYIASGFFNMARNNPLMFMELLFWKTSKDCYELEAGYGAMEREKEETRLAKTWTREQEEELACLYQTYKDEEDVVGCLEAALEGSEVRRSRKQISSQLVKQCLVMDRRKLHRKEKKTKGDWGEEELLRLREVFSQVHALEAGTPNKEVLKAIVDHFPHRGVREVTQQLREEGLLHPPQKTTKKKADERTKYLSASMVDTSEDDSEDDDNDDGGLNSPPPPNTEHSSGCGLDGGDCVARLHASGYSEELEWLEAYLLDEARDRDLDDEWEEMSVVAVSDKVAKALNTPAFSRLLGMLGLQPPSGQESYWRIPSTMSPQQLTTAAHSLKPSGPADNSGGFPSAEQDDYRRGDRSKAEALDELQRNKGKSRRVPLSRPPRTRPVPKRPRLALQSEFLDMDSDTSSAQEEGGGRGGEGEGEGDEDVSTPITSSSKIKRRGGRGRRHFGMESSSDEEEVDDDHMTPCEADGAGGGTQDCGVGLESGTDDTSDDEGGLTIDLDR